MARTHPQHDWSEPSPATRRTSGAEWESLRNELVALLDQVEDQVAVSQTPRPQPVPSPVSPPTRHAAALRSVRQAVTRLADRSETEERPAARESVEEAISQIRARQTGGRTNAAPAWSGAEQTTEIAGLAQSLDAIGERIGRFEAQVGARLDRMGSTADISAQIAQLSEVIELLAGAVGETSHIRRIEAQIGNLAKMVAAERDGAGDTTARRIEDLAGAIEKLTAYQIESAGRAAQQAAEADEKQIQTLEMIEASVRNIYERIDALEAAEPQSSPEIERLSRDMAALTEAMSAKAAPMTLLDKIDALSARIETMEAPNSNAAATLSESIAVLREVIAETIEPRFARIEDRIGALDATAAAPVETSEIEEQLRQISRRVEETSAQLKSLAEGPESGLIVPQAPDLDALADLITERMRGLAPESAAEGDGVEKADLEALEERLARLFAQAGSSAPDTGEHLLGVKSSIAQVDSRIARLEAMLNGKQQAEAPAEPRPEPAPRSRSKPDDAMPVDPVSGAVRRVLSQPVVAEPQAGPPLPATEKPFHIDPDAIDRPAKPQPSFLAGKESPFAPERKSEPAPGASRSSFIEAARRSARQQEPEDADAPKSLIARALARFQRGEDAAEETIAAVAEDIPVEPVVIPEPERDEADEAMPGFLARNRRVLLLGVALVAAVALTLPLVFNRAAPPAPAQPAAETAAVPEEPAPVEELEPLVPAEDEAAPEEDAPTTSGDLMSGVRVIEQQPSLSAGRVDVAALVDGPALDPIETAAIPAANGYLPSATQAPLPPIAVPEEVSPPELRVAAEAGDMFAQFEVGAIFTEGTVVAQDFAQAAAWYERSAAQGFAPAQYRLGSLYESGRGVERDLELARLWYQRAAEAGNRMSMHNLASLYAGGELDAQDFGAAAHWFEEAATRGLTDSQFNLGMLYARGLGVEQDFEKSYVWFSLAARSGDQDAANGRDDVARSLDADTVQRLNETVAAWTPSEIDLKANFAPIGTWNEAFDPGPPVTNSDVILRVQVLLGKLGYDVGTPDGIAGPKTREAIAAFERATGMNESGAINPRLLAVLGSQPV